MFRLRTLRFALFVCLVVLNVAATPQTAKPASPTAAMAGQKLKNPVSATPTSVAAGQQLYQKYCRFCHGETGNGQGPMIPKGVTPSNLIDATWDRGSTDGDIFTVIQEGAAPKFEMKGLKGKLSDQDTWNLVNYVRSLSQAGKD